MKQTPQSVGPRDVLKPSICSDRVSMSLPVKTDTIVDFEGTVSLYASNMIENNLVDLTEGTSHPVYVHCWIDRDRDMVSQVSFKEGDSMGRFKLSLPFRDGDSSALKFQVTMWAQDPESGNERTVPLCTSCAFVDRMLEGHTDVSRINNEFMPQNYCKMSMRITNLSEVQNNRPRLKDSALLRIPDLNRGLESVNSYFASTHERNCTVFRPEVAGMKDGMSRSFQWMLFLSLMAGTPAYTLIPCAGVSFRKE